jgi:hypothetical protein
MEEPAIVLPRWSSRIRTADERDYVAYIETTDLDDYRATPGNLGCQMLLRSLPDAEALEARWMPELVRHDEDGHQHQKTKFNTRPRQTIPHDRHLCTIESVL